MEQMITSMRLKHLSYRTEQTYVGWMRKFYTFIQGQAPEQLNSRHGTDYSTYLAVERKVAKSTQNQAFNAILFFFRHVLDKDMGDLWRAVRSKKKERLPVVLSQTEIMRLFDDLFPVDLLSISQFQSLLCIVRAELIQLRTPLYHYK